MGSKIAAFAEEKPSAIKWAENFAFLRAVATVCERCNQDVRLRTLRAAEFPQIVTLVDEG
jgi:hypothetical protein